MGSCVAGQGGRTWTCGLIGRQCMIQALPLCTANKQCPEKISFYVSIFFWWLLMKWWLESSTKCWVCFKKGRIKTYRFQWNLLIQRFSASSMSPVLCSCISLWEGDEFVGLSPEGAAQPSLILLESRGEVCSALRSGDCWCLGPNKDLLYRLGKDLALWGDSFCATASILV